MNDPIAALQPLLAEARTKKLWIKVRYHELWLSPAEFEAELAAGRFQWTPDKFQLREPNVRMSELAAELTKALHNIEDFRHRVEAWQWQQKTAESGVPA